MKRISGIVALIISVLLLIFTFYPLLTVQVNYYQKAASPEANKPLVPIDDEFGIVIPKLFANARVVANVNPYNEREYQFALTQGVAHAKGTALPGQEGNIFLFSHSSANFYEANRFNSIFYLIDKLNTSDTIELYYKKEKFVYVVSNKKIVDAKDVSYLTQKSQEKTLTLMTCWPAGTSFKRLLVIASLH